MESNDSPEIPDRGKTSDVPGLPSEAARTATQTKRSDHITPILYELHWPPVEMRTDYKLLSLVYSCLNGIAPFTSPESTKETTKNTLESEYFPLLHSNCGTVCL